MVEEGFLVVRVVGLADGRTQLVPGRQLVGGRDDAVCAAHDGFSPRQRSVGQRGVEAGDAGQLVAYLVQRAAGRAFEEPAEGGAVGTHAAQELVERGARQSVERTLVDGGRNAAPFVDGVGRAVQGGAAGHVQACRGQHVRGGPYAHRPAYDVHLGVGAQGRGVEVQCAVVVTDLVVHPLRAVVTERRFVCRPSGKEQEQAGMVFVDEVELFHSFPGLISCFCRLRTAFRGLPKGFRTLRTAFRGLPKGFGTLRTAFRGFPKGFRTLRTAFRGLP